MRPLHLTPAERRRAASVNQFAMIGFDAETKTPEVEDDADDAPVFVRCKNCDGHGFARETYGPLGGYYREDCPVCNGEGVVQVGRSFPFFFDYQV